MLNETDIDPNMIGRWRLETIEKEETKEENPQEGIFELIIMT